MLGVNPALTPRRVRGRESRRRCRRSRYVAGVAPGDIAEYPFFLGAFPAAVDGGIPGGGERSVRPELGTMGDVVGAAPEKGARLDALTSAACPQDVGGELTMLATVVNVSAGL